MKSLKFKQFMTGRWRSNGHHQMYIVRNRKEVLYVGIARVDVWSRWFDRFMGRMYQRNGEWNWSDSISREIVENLPKSLNYTVDLLTLDDAINLCREELVKSNFVLDRLRIDDVEGWVIRRFCPALNYANNSVELPPEVRRSRMIELIAMEKSA